MVDIAAIGEMLSGLRQAIELVNSLEVHIPHEQRSKGAELVQILGSLRGQLFEAQTLLELETNLQETSTLNQATQHWHTGSSPQCVSSAPSECRVYESPVR